jgi:hypothetical protein
LAVLGHCKIGQRSGLSAGARLCQCPATTQLGRADQPAGGADIGPDRLFQRLNEALARRAPAGFAAPEADVAIIGERAADRGEMFRVARDGRGGPFAGGEADPSRRAMRDDMDRGDA